MVEENPWKPLFWRRVAAVDQNVRTIRDDLAAVQQQLASPPVGNSVTISKSIVACAEDKLREASRALGLTVCYMEAALLLARCRGGLIAQGRVRCYGRVHDDDLAVRRALFYFRLAKTRGEEAYDALDSCRGHLGAVERLLHHDRVPGVAEHVDAERASTVGDLEATRQLMVDIDGFISVALDNGSDVV
ncbi:hypothetical protein E2562_036848 [Oryza meyeriana var. granulata]|uniref:BRO1 domain-containing protein n=1 Tax=Oryza meyeriana var. granulata TaxID=110450 RepID=A0A6G1E6N3_9ORYZ|nr:hypothetical protein E2562_036848 [Oryza meyeriana var. granulata]